MTARTLGNVDAFTSFKDRVVINVLISAVDIGQSLGSGTDELGGFQTSVRTVDRQTVSFIRGGEVGGLVQQNTVAVFDVDDKSIVNVDCRIKHALIRTVSRKKFLFAEEIVDVIILCHNG